MADYYCTTKSFLEWHRANYDLATAKAGKYYKDGGDTQDEVKKRSELYSYWRGYKSALQDSIHHLTSDKVTVDRFISRETINVQRSLDKCKEKLRDAEDIIELYKLFETLVSRYELSEEEEKRVYPSVSVYDVFDTRLANALANGGYANLNQIANAPFSEIKGLRNIGEKGVETIKEVLKESAKGVKK